MLVGLYATLQLVCLDAVSCFGIAETPQWITSNNEHLADEVFTTPCYGSV